MTVSAEELVRMAADHMGGQARLAEAMGLGPSGSSQVSRWASGTNGLNYENTMKLLEACGWLRIGHPQNHRNKTMDERLRLLDQAEKALKDLRGGL